MAVGSSRRDSSSLHSRSGLVVIDTVQDNGHSITASYIQKLIDRAAPSIKSLAAGVNDDHVAIAASYLKDQLQAPWASDFLTSDLMPYLERVDGSRWVRSAL